MANFKKGQTNNPKGRPRIAKPLQKMRKISRDRIAKVCDDLTRLPLNEVKAIWEAKETDSLRAMLAGIIYKAGAERDHTSLNALFDRMVGKVKDIQEVTTKRLEVKALPTGSEMISSAMRTAATQLRILEDKVKRGIELSESEQRSLTTLSKTVIELNEEERKLRGSSSLAQLSDKELSRRVEEAKKVLAKQTSPKQTGPKTLN